MKTKKILLSTAILLAIGFSACNKDANETTDVSQPAFETEANNLSDEIEKSADAVTFDKSGGDYDLAGCASVTVFYPEGTPFPKIITIDFGETNCQVRPNVMKRGKVIISVSDSLINQNAKRIVTFENFYINDYAVTGTRKITNLGTNSDGFPVFDINNNFSVGEWSRQATGTKTWIEGYDSMDYSDNVFLLDGSSSTTRPNEVVINRTITQPLRIDRSCGYITEGILTIQWNDNSAIIDFGDGTCDDVATITNNGEVFEIDLDKFRWRRLN
jgi:hypothetical protein